MNPQDMMGRCTECGQPAYITCFRCAAILSTNGEKHNCPEADEDEGFEELDEELCLKCEDRLYPIKEHPFLA
jgi:hypothetical protein